MEQGPTYRAGIALDITLGAITRQSTAPVHNAIRPLLYLPMKTRFVLIVLSIVLPIAAFAADRGVFGFSMDVDSEGFFLNPTLRSIKIGKVAPESPASRAGMKPGDEVVEVAGRLVAGAKGREIQSLAEKEVGQSLTLKVKHAAGDVVSITMVAVERQSPK